MHIDTSFQEIHYTTLDPKCKDRAVYKSMVDRETPGGYNWHVIFKVYKHQKATDWQNAWFPDRSHQCPHGTKDHSGNKTNGEKVSTPRKPNSWKATKPELPPISRRRRGRLKTLHFMVLSSETHKNLLPFV